LFARPWLDWHTVRAGQFDIHYPTELASWAQFVAERLPAVDTAVSRLVGYSPPMRIQIVVEDPFDISNGFAFTLLDKPVIVFWASPPDPRESIGQFQTWGEMLAVHEFGHVAHLTRPSRNPWTRLLWRLSPVPLGPIAVRSPRWVIEGYATYIEGVITGTGRPHGVWRPAILRQWALEGRLPNYAQISDWSDFQGGEFAYLAGSAFLEWLARHQGDSTLVQLWRRLSARTTRTFDEAFAGVYGDIPAVLYDRFRAEVTADAVGLDSAIARLGLVEGELVQHLPRATGDPAISRDGKRVAVVLRSAVRPSRVVVWSTATESDSSELRARERLLKRDPEDVPARRIYPLPKRVIASLVARDGRPYEDPRWFPDGRHILVWRATRRSDGSQRPELYVWDVARGEVRRLTNSLGVRNADPSPDGRTIAALQCPGGHCDVVSIDVASGRLTRLAAGDVATSYARPRWSPDGRTIALSMQRENRWRIALLDAAGGQARFPDPDDGSNRFDPDWLSSSALVVVSDRGGTPNLERLALDSRGSGPPSLTRVIGAVIAPTVNPADGSVWFLSLHSRGYDVRRLAPPVPVDEVSAPLHNSRLVPAVVEKSAAVRSFSPSPTSPERRYASALLGVRWLPAASIGQTGREATFALASSDVVGRLTMLGQVAFGSGDAWRGGSFELAWRGWRPIVRAAFFDAMISYPLLQPLAFGTPFSRADQLWSGRARFDYSHAFDQGDLRAGLGGAAGQLVSDVANVETSGDRLLVFGELSALARQSGYATSASESLTAQLTSGATYGIDYQRFLGTVGLHAAMRGLGLPFSSFDAAASYGRVSSNAPGFEQFLIGGLPTSIIDASLLTQRLTMGALPAGVASGDRLLTYRVSVPLAGLAPYFWGASTSAVDRFEQWHRVLGVDLAIDQSALPVLGLPGAHLVAGVGYSLDKPLVRATRGYLAVTLRP
jgi:Tol biopolymer transport system component